MMHVVVPVLPDRKNQAQCPRPVFAYVRIDVVISPFPRYLHTVSDQSHHECVMARNHLKRVMRTEPLVKSA